MAVELISKSAYARHRGCDEKAVRKAVNEGRISLIDGKIDPTVADIQWERNTRARISRTAPGQLNLDAAALSSGSSADGVGDFCRGDGYTANRGRREAADAEMAELRLAEAQGSLIRIEAVKSALGSVFSTTRDALLQIPARLSPLLAAESDPATVQTMLYTELHQALQHLAGAPARIGQTVSTSE